MNILYIYLIIGAIFTFIFLCKSFFEINESSKKCLEIKDYVAGIFVSIITGIIWPFSLYMIFKKK